MAEKLKDIISSTNELAALPVTTVRLLDLLEDTTVEAEKVLAIIGKDPALTANLLKLCNSAYYGMRRQIGSVKEALILLGNRTVVTLAFATSMGDVLRGQLSAYRLAKDQMWHHSLAAAIAASHLMGMSAGRDLAERAFTAGLVHDIGKLILNRLLVKQMDQLPVDGSDLDLLAAERKILGFDHCEAGGALAEAWNFPSMLVTAVMHHHRPEAAHSDTRLLKAVSAANLIARAVGLGGGSTEPVSTETLVELADADIPEAGILHLTENLGNELEELLAFVGTPA